MVDVAEHVGIGSSDAPTVQTVQTVSDGTKKICDIAEVAVDVVTNKAGPNVPYELSDRKRRRENDNEQKPSPKRPRKFRICHIFNECKNY